MPRETWDAGTVGDRNSPGRFCPAGVFFFHDANSLNVRSTVSPGDSFPSSVTPGSRYDSFVTFPSECANAASLLLVIGLIVGAFYSFGLWMGLVSFALAMPTVRFAHGLSLPFARGTALFHRLHELSAEPSDQLD